MGLPSISERKHIRLIPDPPTEPTSTIVLTSAHSYYVDVRLLKPPSQTPSAPNVNPHTLFSADSLSWAFAGTSHSSIVSSSSKAGSPSVSRSVWDHWIDSKSDDPAPDEGDMYVQENGDVLELGTQKHPDTGEVVGYEELWGEWTDDEEATENGALVARVEDTERNIRGLVIRIGGWCQGILKRGKGEDALTVERWQYGVASWLLFDSFDGKSEDEDEKRWCRTFRKGKDILPCRKMCEASLGRFALNEVLHDAETDVEWKIIEN